MENLETAYIKREIGAFDSLLYDSHAAGDTTEGYTFRFWDEDVRRGNVPDATWGREKEMGSAAAMFSSSEVEDIDIKLTYTPPYYDTTQGHAGQQIIYVTNASLSVVIHQQDQPEPLTLMVVSNLARFRFKVQYVDAKGDSIWRIVYWEDLGTPGGLKTVNRTTWGKVKSLFGP